MGKRVTNINNGGTVGIQADGDAQTTKDTETDTEVTNIADGGTVGIQGANVSGCTVIQSW